MIHDGIIKGINIELKAVTETDAQFIIDLRTDNQINKYIHATDKNLIKQQEWIQQQRNRDGDYYFVIKSDNHLWGTISLYNINYNEKEGEFGRWICPNNSIFAYESVFLLYEFAFVLLQLERVYTLTVKENFKVINFHKKNGARFVKERKTDNFILVEQEVMRHSYSTIREERKRMLEAIARRK